jgi:hypothetical protein
MARDTGFSVPKPEPLPKQTSDHPVTPVEPTPKPKQPRTAPVTPALKPRQRQAANIGPFAQIVQSAIERIQEIANAFGKCEALVVVLVLIGTYFVRDAHLANVWPICSLIVLGVTTPLIADFLQKWRP